MDEKKLFLFAIFSGFIAIYLIPSPISVIFIWLAFVSSANSVRQIARYGLGTGTSSIGYWGTAVGVTMAFISIWVYSEYSVYFAVFSALIVGGVTGIVAQKIIKMKIPVMILDSAILASSTSIISFYFISFMNNNVLIYPLIYISITLAVLHPYNGSMGAGENQERTLYLSCVEASMTTALFGIIMILSDNLYSGIIIFIISKLGFFVFAKKWYSLIKKETYEIKWTGYPKAEH